MITEKTKEHLETPEEKFAYNEGMAVGTIIYRLMGYYKLTQIEANKVFDKVIKIRNKEGKIY